MRSIFLLTQFLCAVNTPEACPVPAELSGYGYGTMQNYVASYLNLSSPENSFSEAGWIVLILAVCRVIAILSLQFISHIKR